MATKQTKQTNESPPALKAKIERLVKNADSKVKAYAGVNIGNAYAIHGIKVIDGEKGLFVSMPQSSYQKDGKTQYTDQFHAITAEARTALNDAVLAAYDERIHMEEDESQDSSESEDSGITPTM